MDRACGSRDGVQARLLLNAVHLVLVELVLADDINGRTRVDDPGSLILVRNDVDYFWRFWLRELLVEKVSIFDRKAGVVLIDGWCMQGRIAWSRLSRLRLGFGVLEYLVIKAGFCDMQCSSRLCP